jgi:Domain of unknown function (DUF5664)
MKTKKSKATKKIKEQALRYNTGKLEWHHIPMFLLEDLMKVGEIGGKKYFDYNYLTGFPITQLLNSLKRHLNSFESPFESDYDVDTAQSHLQHVAWNALVAAYVMKYKPEFDNRYKITKKRKK